jgi:hypothetical protein
MENLPAKQTRQPIGLINSATSGQLQIRHLKNTVPIEQALVLCFQSVGLRPRHFPRKDPEFNEWQFLLDFVRDNYGGLTAKEIILAFKLAAQHKLPIDKDKVSPYDNFSPEYFGRIMEAYKEYKAKTLRLTHGVNNKPALQEEKHDRKEYYKVQLFDKYRLLLEGRYTWDDRDEYFLFLALKRLGLNIDLPKKRIDEYKQAKENLKGNRFLTIEKQESDLRDKYMREAFRTWIKDKADNLEDIERLVLAKLK